MHFGQSYIYFVLNSLYQNKSARRYYQIMLSRRNIRVKVMQLLYAIGMDSTLTYKDLENRYNRDIQSSYELYIFNLYQLMKIAEYVKSDAAKRAAKLLPTEEDKYFSPKLFENENVQSIVNNEGYKALLKKYKLETKNDKDTNRLLYTEFAKSEDFKNYLLQKDKSSLADHLDILLKLYKFLVNNETFEEHLDDRYSCYIHDKSLVVGAMKKTLKASPLEGAFYDQYVPDDETTKEFGLELLYKVFHQNDELLSIIKPVLKNWEADRVANIDMILLKMAVCELINFETIPTKVTINEFVDISKIYSTPKSKDFINGILDKLMKLLQKEGKIIKKGRGLVD